MELRDQWAMKIFSLLYNNHLEYTHDSKWGVLLRKAYEAADIALKEREEVLPKKKPTKNFIKPGINDIICYCKSRKNNVNANSFYDFYESKNWMIGKNKMKNWHAAVRQWENRDNSKPIGTYREKVMPKLETLN
jgi:hypothetical protein